MADLRTIGYNTVASLFAVYQLFFAFGIPKERTMNPLGFLSIFLAPGAIPLSLTELVTPGMVDPQGVMIFRVFLFLGGTYVALASILAVPFVRHQLSEWADIHIDRRTALALAVSCIPVNLILILLMIMYAFSS